MYDSSSGHDQIRPGLGNCVTAETASSLVMMQSGFRNPYRLSSGKCGSFDGVGSDDREAGEFDLEFHEIYEDVLGVEFAVSTAAGHLCGRGGGVFGPDGVAGFGQRLPAVDRRWEGRR